MHAKAHVREDNFTCFCQHAKGDVHIASTVVFPADTLPDSPPRVINRSCNHFVDCSLRDKSECAWAIASINRLH